VTSAEPTLAIVVPTHNRRASIERTLRAFSTQSCLGRVVEAIVVADGCTDGTADIPRDRWPLPVRIVEQPRRGAAAARNRGAAAATADVLVFLDDDIEVCPGFVAAHARAHSDGDDRRVAIGYLPPDLQGRRDFFAVMLRSWWEAMFDRMRDSGHRFSYSDLLSGNVSMRRSLFEEVGGFDESFQCHEDYELGCRLIGAGARFSFVEAAAGWHHERTDLARALQRKRDEGRADVALARRHPAVTAALPLCRWDSSHVTWRGGLLRTLALAHPGAGDLLESRCRSMLALLEAGRLRTRWRRLLDDLLAYWYWRGVGETIGDETVAQLCELARRPAPVPCELDLRAGLAAAVQTLDHVRPEALRLCWGSRSIGMVPAEAGAEPLAGRHLSSILRSRFARPLGEALVRTGEIDVQQRAASIAPSPRAADADAGECSVVPRA
jgi:GT2 family glycosyltransferase